MITRKSFEDLISLVMTIKLPEQDYAFFGDLPLFLNNLIDGIDDVDIIARGLAWEKALQLGKTEPAKHGGQKIVLFDHKIEIFNYWPHENINELIDGADIIDGLRVVKMGYVLNYMKSLHRPKDKTHILKIISHLKTYL